MVTGCARGGQLRRVDYPQSPPGKHRLPRSQNRPLHTHCPPTQLPGDPALHWASALQEQTPAAQKNPFGQARPHAPQLDGSASRLWQPAGVWQHVSERPQEGPPLQEQASGPVAVRQVSPERQTVGPHLQSPVSFSHEPVDESPRQLEFSAQPHVPGTSPQTSPPP